MSQRIQQVLRAANVFSADVDCQFEWSLRDDLIPQLEAFSAIASGFDSCFRKWLNEVSGVHSLRLIQEPRLQALLGDRLIYLHGLPQAIDRRRFLGIASSRVGRSYEDKSVWFRSLRAACVVAARRDEILLTSQGTSADRFVKRCEDLFGVTVCVASVSQARNVAAWFHNGLMRSGDGHTPSILISPRLPPTDDSNGAAQSLRMGKSASETAVDEICPPNEDEAPDDCPLADRALAALSDRLIVLSARSRGNWERLAQWRVRSGYFSPGATLLALGDNATTDKARDRLLTAGVVGWAVRGSDPTGDKPVTAGDSYSPDPHSLDRSQRVTGLDFVGSAGRFRLDEFLAHCTRRRDGPWPNQSEQAYIDDLILERSAADHSALATLTRIVQMKCLLGASESIQGDTPVVSLTAVPLDELKQLRVFRSHRGCWDFEPYGICIRKDWIQRQNGKPVRYASRNEWDSMSAIQRLFCHLDRSITKTGNEIDWTVEQEWRVPGDLDLSMLTAADAFVFVPTPEDARRLGDCPWPIIALSDLGPLEQ